MIKSRKFNPISVTSVSPEDPGGGSRYFTQRQVHGEFKENGEKKKGLEWKTRRQEGL